jgi:hypothetical protein
MIVLLGKWLVPGRTEALEPLEPQPELLGLELGLGLGLELELELGLGLELGQEPEQLVLIVFLPESHL